MTDVVNPKSTSPDQLLPYHKKISAEGKARMICFISYTYMALKSRPGRTVPAQRQRLSLRGRGCRLSGGKKQRISIARCFLKETSVLIADEASAALDSETSFHIMNEILQMKVLTRIVVFHSMNQSLLKQYDQIIIMKNGKVQEVGRFEELMERKGYFYSLYCIEKGL